jgi:hypothetical protein
MPVPVRERLLSQKVHSRNREARVLDYAVRFLVGGLVVSAFAVLGDVLRPKSFAGLFGAAPSVALATLTLANLKHGSAYAAVEGRSMVLGALALLFYCIVVCQILVRFRFSAVAATGSALAVWVLVAFGLKQLVVG